MARKSEIRTKARAGLDSLMAAMTAPDEQRSAQHLQEALEHISDAAGILPDGVSLRELAAREQHARDAGDVLLRERDFTTTQRVALAKRGHAIPVKNDRGEIIGGRYPIETREDLENAVNDADRTRAGSKERKHIARQARRIGAADAIPAGWEKKQARESAPLTLRERAAVGEISLLESLDPDARQEPGVNLLDALGLDADEYRG